MLPPFIIEFIREKERKEQQKGDAIRPRVEISYIPLYNHSEENRQSDNQDRRGVCIIDL